MACVPFHLSPNHDMCPMRLLPLHLTSGTLWCKNRIWLGAVLAMN
ncbi:hypothetical protein CCACVL1_07617 [Corchorus capsularis]|uniref:Uncharacterized protein n=1 Tax=Corchorus capsularis TaxID=210143 RepID=A0A1R3J4Q7_COCAP|nr:hypothetical protein CCACVL1_07617 [Corchorus capsularis]